MLKSYTAIQGVSVTNNGGEVEAKFNPWSEGGLQAPDGENGETRFYLPCGCCNSLCAVPVGETNFLCNNCQRCGFKVCDHD